MHVQKAFENASKNAFENARESVNDFVWLVETGKVTQFKHLGFQ